LPAVYREPDEPLDQGDILAGVPFVAREVQQLDIKVALGVVTSHGCDNEGYFRAVEREEAPRIVNTHPVHVAPIYTDLAYLEADGKLNQIKSGAVRRYFYLPEEDPLPEAVIDLFYEQPVPAVVLESLERRGSLSKDYWEYLLVHMWVRRSRMEPEDVFIGGLS
jgi:hypothetical protein